MVRERPARGGPWWERVRERKRERQCEGRSFRSLLVIEITENESTSVTFYSQLHILFQAVKREERKTKTHIYIGLETFIM